MFSFALALQTLVPKPWSANLGQQTLVSKLWSANHRNTVNTEVSAVRTPELLGIAQSAPRAAQSRAESPRAVAQSCSRHRSKLLRARPEPLRAPQTRPERSLRAAQNRPELLEKPIGELGVTCTLHIICAVLLDVVLSPP